MDLEMLSRVHFGLTIGFHYLFPPLSIGLGLFLLDSLDENPIVERANVHDLLISFLGGSAYRAVPERTTTTNPVQANTKYRPRSGCCQDGFALRAHFAFMGGPSDAV